MILIGSLEPEVQKHQPLESHIRFFCQKRYSLDLYYFSINIPFVATQNIGTLYQRKKRCMHLIKYLK